MRKAPVIALSVGVVAAAVCLPPLFIKPIVQQQLSDWQGSVGAFPGYQLSIEAKRDGWFSSDYEGKLVYDLSNLDPEFDGQHLTIPVDLATHYGPVLWSGGGNLATASMTISVARTGVSELFDASSWDDRLPLYSMNIVRDFGGHYTFKDKADSFDLHNKARNITLAFGGYQGTGRYQEEVLQYQGQLNSLNSNLFDSLVMENYKFAVTRSGPFDGLFSGAMADQKAEATLDRFGIAGVVIEGIQGTTSTQVDKTTSLGNIQSVLKAESVSYADYKAQDVSLKVDLANLSNEFIGRYIQFNQSMTTPEQPLEQLTPFLEENLVTLLEPSPELNITQLHAQFEQGNIDFNAHSRIEGVDDQFDTAMLSQSPAYLLQFVQANASLLIDETLLNELVKVYASLMLSHNLSASGWSKEQYDEALQQVQQKVIANLVAQGIFVRDKTRYSSEFSFANSSAVLNDQTLDL